MTWKSAHSWLDTIHKWSIKYNLDALIEDTEVGRFAFDAQAKHTNAVFGHELVHMGYYDPAVVTSHVCGHSLLNGHEPRMLGLDPMSIEGDSGFWEN